MYNSVQEHRIWLLWSLGILNYMVYDFILFLVHVVQDFCNSLLNPAVKEADKGL